MQADWEHLMAFETARIIDAAVEVRKAQKMYFKTRAKVDLVASKQAEKRLDDLLAVAGSSRVPVHKPYNPPFAAPNGFKPGPGYVPPTK